METNNIGFNVGDRVTMIVDYECHEGPQLGDTGTIIEVFTESCLVEYDNPIINGHNGWWAGKCKDGYGWFTMTTDIALCDDSEIADVNADDFILLYGGGICQ